MEIYFNRFIRTGTFIKSVVEVFDDYNNLLKGKAVYHISDLINVQTLRENTKFFYADFNRLIAEETKNDVRIKDMSSMVSPARNFQVEANEIGQGFIVLSICLFLPMYICYLVRPGVGPINYRDENLVECQEIADRLKLTVQNSFGSAYEQWSLKECRQNIDNWNNELIQIKHTRICDICFDYDFIDMPSIDL